MNSMDPSNFGQTRHGPTRHESVEALLRFFAFEHLADERLRDISKSFHDQAYRLVDEFGLQGPELTVGLRKLLEAKDCAVRAAL